MTHHNPLGTEKNKYFTHPLLHTGNCWDVGKRTL